MKNIKITYIDNSITNGNFTILSNKIIFKAIHDGKLYQTTYKKLKLEQIIQAMKSHPSVKSIEIIT